jgi:hypothetical protein
MICGYSVRTMVQRLQGIVAHHERLRDMRLVPKLSYGRQLLRKDGAPNRMFLTCLFINHELAIHFLKELGLIPREVQCSKCQRYMGQKS